MNRVLVFFGEESQFEELTLMLRHAGVHATAARSPDALRSALADPYDAVIAPFASFAAVPELGRSQAQRIAVASRSQSASLEEAMGRDIDDYLMSPLREEELRLALRRPTQPRPAPMVPDHIVGIENGLAKPWKVAQRAAGFDADVLLTGESGTGKELFAQAIHRLSKRNGAAFVPVNCAAIPEGLAESLLFGHVEGAFTGAHSTTTGVFAKADKGTLFLDEVGDFSPEIQVKLLRALQTGEVQPLGSAQSQTADVRVVAATSRDLPAMVAAGTFREDLYYRLAVIPIELPPLRDRPGDIEALIAHFLAAFATRHQVPSLALTDDAKRLLMKASWPGNVRELQNAIERLVVLCEEDEIGTELVNRELETISAAASSVGHGITVSEGTTLKQAMRLVEAEFIRSALAACDGKRGACAEYLAISQRTLLYKLKEHGIQ
tara:strand:+ start:38131 stop:39438 length:1308 start_codon:yes stop_codon:yes gene_type:complete